MASGAVFRRCPWTGGGNSVKPVRLGPRDLASVGRLKVAADCMDGGQENHAHIGTDSLLCRKQHDEQ